MYNKIKHINSLLIISGTTLFGLTGNGARAAEHSLPEYTSEICKNISH